MFNKNTAKGLGAEPTVTIWEMVKRTLNNERGEVGDLKPEDTAKAAGAESAGKEKEIEAIPFDKDPRWQSARAAEKKLTDLLTVNECEDVEALLELVEEGKTLKGKIKNVGELDGILEKAQQMAEYEEFWAKEDAKKTLASEEPDDTVRRLEREKDDLTRKLKAKEESEGKATEAERAITGYENSVVEQLSALKDLPEAAKGFMAEFLGVGNACNDIDISDKKAVAKLAKQAETKYAALQAAIIKDYVAGKVKIPSVRSVEGAPIAPEEEVKSLKSARQTLKELITPEMLGNMFK